MQADTGNISDNGQQPPNHLTRFKMGILKLFKILFPKDLTAVKKKVEYYRCQRYEVSLIRDAQIAQLVEQRTENPRVVGSIPTLGTVQV